MARRLLALIAVGLLLSILPGQAGDKKPPNLEKLLAKLNKTLASDQEASKRLRAVLARETNVPLAHLSRHEADHRASAAELYLLYAVAFSTGAGVEQVLEHWQSSGRNWTSTAGQFQVPLANLERWAEQVDRLVQDKAQPAPDFTVTRLDGQEIRLEACRGKIVVLEFWATWCQQCMVQLPDFEGLFRKYQDKGVEFLAVSVDQEREKVPAMLAQKRWTFPVAYLTAELNAGYGGRDRPIGTPALYIVDQRRRIRFFHSRYTPSLRGQLEDKIKELFQEAD